MYDGVCRVEGNAVWCRGKGSMWWQGQGRKGREGMTLSQPPCHAPHAKPRGEGMGDLRYPRDGGWVTYAHPGEGGRERIKG